MSDPASDTGIKVVITVAIIAVAIVAAIIISRLMNKCYDNRVSKMTDYSDDVSENVQDLIRTRLSVIQYRKREQQKSKRNKVLKVFREWASRVQDKNRSREAAIREKRPPVSEEDTVVTIDKEVSDIKQNGGPRTPRFPFFTGGSLAGGAQRPSNGFRSDTTISVSPVPKGRPVSSIPRVFPKVIVTSADGNLSKVLPKSVLKDTDKNGVTKVIKQNGVKT